MQNKDLMSQGLLVSSDAGTLCFDKLVTCLTWRVTSQQHRRPVSACTYHGEDEEARADSGSAVEHGSNVVTQQLDVIRCVWNQDWRQQETDGDPQLARRHTDSHLRLDEHYVENKTLHQPSLNPG